MKNLVEATPNAVWVYTNRQIEHGDALKRLVQLATEDLLMFIEDDGFIFRPGKVNECFDLIESGEYDAVGGRRGSCSQWLYDKASEKFNVNNSGYGDTGPNFWPNFFFAKREDLLKVTNFGAKAWEGGEMVKPLGLPAPQLQASDTMVEASLELRDMGLTFKYENQYHLSADDIEAFHNGMNVFDGRAKWLHVGSLSSGINGILVDSEGRSLGKRTIQKPGDAISDWRPNTEDEKLEIERRIVWFLLAFQYSKPERLPELREEYAKAIEQCIANYALSQSRIGKRKNIYKEFMP